MRTMTMGSQFAAAAALPLLATTAAADVVNLDLAQIETDRPGLLRLYGSTGDGSLGLPVAAGDLDGDGFVDLAFAVMQASPLDRPGAGEVFVYFGRGEIQDAVDTAIDGPDLLRIAGGQASEHAGGEIWIADVTGEGVADLLICRQDHSPEPDRIGAGALTIVNGGPELRALAELDGYLDLDAIPASLTTVSLVGRDVQDRLGIWVRAGDVDGDGVNDLVVGADQLDLGPDSHAGSAFVLRGGAHLTQSLTVDLADFGLPGPLSTHLAWLRPPAASEEYHFGGTVQIGDLDGNGRSEVLVAATLNRSGASLAPVGATEPVHVVGGTPRGTVFIFWDDNLGVADWSGLVVVPSNAPGAVSRIDGVQYSVAFGEELLAGEDYDSDGQPDLFIGDLVGGSPDREAAGRGHVIYGAADLKGLETSLDGLPEAMERSDFLGPVAGAIAGDTAIHGDFNGDGFADLAFSSPHARPFGRANAGTLHIVPGSRARWPQFVDLAAPDKLHRLIEVHGASGDAFLDRGDTLAYSAAAADVDNDGTPDIVTNEMVGNGVAPDTVDVGNLIVLGLRPLEFLFTSGFE